MTWLSIIVLLYLGSLGFLLLFFAGASVVNERADVWADDLYDYLVNREWRRAA